MEQLFGLCEQLIADNQQDTARLVEMSIGPSRRNINWESNGMKKLATYRYSETDAKNGRSFYDLFIGLNDEKVRYETIEYGSLKIYPWFRILLSDRCKVALKWVKSSQNYLQGVKVSLRNTRARLLDGSDSEIKNDAVLMYDFWFPDAVLLYCTPMKLCNVDGGLKNGWFGLQNVCRTRTVFNYTVSHMEPCCNVKKIWHGNYGVVIEATAISSYRLYFSCGYAMNFSNITFEDLVLDVFVNGDHTADFQCSFPEF